MRKYYIWFSIVFIGILLVLVACQQEQRIPTGSSQLTPTAAAVVHPNTPTAAAVVHPNTPTATASLMPIGALHSCNTGWSAIGMPSNWLGTGDGECAAVSTDQQFSMDHLLLPFSSAGPNSSLDILADGSLARCTGDQNRSHAVQLSQQFAGETWLQKAADGKWNGAQVTCLVEVTKHQEGNEIYAFIILFMSPAQNFDQATQLYFEPIMHSFSFIQRETTATSTVSNAGFAATVGMSGNPVNRNAQGDNLTTIHSAVDRPVAKFTQAVLNVPPQAKGVVYIQNDSANPQSLVSDRADGFATFTIAHDTSTSLVFHRPGTFKAHLKDYPLSTDTIITIIITVPSPD